MEIYGYKVPDLLLKFGKLEHLQDLCNGKIYMNESGYFRMLDDNFRGDRFDGKCPIDLQITDTQSLTFFNPKDPTSKIELPCDAIIDFTAGFVGDDKIPLFCCSQVDERILERTCETEWIFKEEFISEMEQFGEHYMIFYKAELLKGIIEHIKNVGANLGEGPVSYRDIFSLYRITELSNPTVNKYARFLNKDIRYRWQNEWRLFLDREAKPMISGEQNHYIASIPPLTLYHIDRVENLRNQKLGIILKD